MGEFDDVLVEIGRNVCWEWLIYDFLFFFVISVNYK